METQLFRADLGISMKDLARLRQQPSKMIEQFIIDLRMLSLDVQVVC